jgi:hypothetical protein
MDGEAAGPTKLGSPDTQAGYMTVIVEKKNLLPKLYGCYFDSLTFYWAEPT